MSIDIVDCSTDCAIAQVTQIECSNMLNPPTGCLQYFTGTTGYMYNFGWVAATTTTGNICKSVE